MSKIIIENKIVFFTPVPTYKISGGIEDYCKKIYRSNVDINFVELSSNKAIDKGNKNFHIDSHSEKNVSYLDVNENKIELVNCRVFVHWVDQYRNFKKVKYTNCEINLVDHGVASLKILKNYIKSDSVFKKIQYRSHLFFIKGILFFKLKQLKNINLVTFTPNDKEIYDKLENGFNKIYTVPLIHLDFDENKNNDFENRKQFVFLGRNTKGAKGLFIDHKNISFLQKVNENIKDDTNKIKFYCSPELNDKNFVRSYKGVSEAREILKNAKYIVLLSKFEGMAMVLIEAVSVGTPIIISDKLDAGKWLLGEGENSIGKSFSIKNAKDISAWIDKHSNDKVLWNQFNENIIKLSKTKINTSSFIEGWKNILSKDKYE